MDSKTELKIPKRILNALLSSLGAGVVPRTGAPYIAIGRKDEIAAFLSDLDAVADGGASCRFLIGRYGSGKSFLIQLIRGYALERDFLSADCDLSPERRLSGGNGAGLATYKELIRNLASKASPDGGALPTVLSRHYSRLSSVIAAEGISPDSEEFRKELTRRVYESVSTLESGVGGFDFSRVLSAYYDACLNDNNERKTACLRWLRGEFSTKTEARHELGFQIGSVIDDDNWYDYLKLFALFASALGYKGLIVYIDECVNLYKIPNRISREANYEKLLAVFNDTLQGRASHLGVIFGGTPQFLEDTRRGLFSYEALRSRLSDSRFTEMGYRTLTQPVIRLCRLSDSELLALLSRLTKLHAEANGEGELLTAEEMTSFLQASLARAGAEEMITPREIIRNYLSLLSVLHENHDARFATLLNRFIGDGSPANGDEDGDGASADFQGADAPKKTVSIADFDF